MLWKRFKRMVRSNVNRILPEEAGATPLDRKLRALRDQDRRLPELTENLVTIKAHVTYLERKLEKLRRREVEEEARVQASQSRGAVVPGATHELALSEVRREVAQAEAELQTAREAMTQAEAVKQAFLEEKAQMVAEAQVALEQEEQEAPTVAQARTPAAAPPAPEQPAAGDDKLDIKVRRRDEEPDGAAAARKTIGPTPAAASGGPATRDAAPGRKTLGPEPAPPAPAPEAPPSVAAEERSQTADEPAEAGAAPAGQAAAAASAGDDLLEELERLGQLREQGALTQDEFEQAKRKLLG